MNSDRNLNGVDLDAVRETIAVLKGEPELAMSRFQITNQWFSGGKNSTTVSSFVSGGTEVQHSQDFTIDADEPAALGGSDTAPNPVEHLLNALAGCVTTTLVAHAAIRGIEIEKIESRLEGSIDLNGFLGLNSATPMGYQNIHMEIRIQTAAESLEALRELLEFSPVYNTLTQGTRVTFDLERL